MMFSAFMGLALAGQNPGVQMDEAATRAAVVRFADCIVAKQSALGREIVLGEKTISRSRWSNFFDDQRCLLEAVSHRDMPTELVALRLKPDQARYAVAEVLVRKDFANLDPSRLAEAPPLVLSTKGKQDIESSALLAFAECAIRANPSAAKNLLFTAINSVDESAAAQALVPAFSGCLLKDRQFKTDLVTIRGNIAVAYYRLASAAVKATAVLKEPQK